MGLSKNSGFYINRKQYDKIRKMDHKDASEYIKNLVNQGADMKIKKLEETHLISLQEALENTRGIGEKIRNDFIGNYNEALKRNMGDSSGF